MADERQLERVLVNLVVNARDGMARGGVLVVETGRRPPAPAPPREPAPARGWVTLAVDRQRHRHRGGVKARIFDPFFTTKSAAQGSGLGLAIVRDIVHGLGGAIEVESEPGAGTSFEVRLVAASEPAPAAHASDITSLAPTVQGSDCARHGLRRACS